MVSVPVEGSYMTLPRMHLTVAARDILRHGQKSTSQKYERDVPCGRDLSTCQYM